MKKWTRLASNILKSELKLRGVTYNQLQYNLEQMGVIDTSNSLRCKIYRGSFQFTFFLQCAMAIGMKNLKLENLVVGKAKKNLR